VDSLGIDVGKKKCRAALKDERGNSSSAITTKESLPLSKVLLIMENVQQ